MFVSNGTSLFFMQLPSFCGHLEPLPLASARLLDLHIEPVTPENTNICFCTTCTRWPRVAIRIVAYPTVLMAAVEKNRPKSACNHVLVPVYSPSSFTRDVLDALRVHEVVVPSTYCKFAGNNSSSRRNIELCSAFDLVSPSPYGLASVGRNLTSRPQTVPRLQQSQS